MPKLQLLAGREFRRLVAVGVDPATARVLCLPAARARRLAAHSDWRRRAQGAQADTPPDSRSVTP